MSAWAVRRRIIYLSAVLLFFFLVFLVIYFVFFKKPETCFDGIQNQNELGVDCGGVCRAVCSSEVSPLIKDWTRFFPTIDGKYDVATLIENPNFNLGIKELDYTFKLYDADGLYITEKSGKAFVNAHDKFVIFETGLDAGKRTPVKAMIEFKNIITWTRVDIKSTKPEIKVQNQQIVEGQMPRLSAQVINNSILDLSNMVITAVVYDLEGNAIGVSQTFVNYLRSGEAGDISFTWPTAFLEMHPAFEIYPRIDLMKNIQ